MKKYLLIKNQLLFWIMLLSIMIIILVFAGVVLYPAKDQKIVLSEVQEISENIRRHYAQKPDYWGLNTQTVVEKSLADQKQIRRGKIFSRIGREIIVGQDLNGSVVMPGQHFFVISIPNLSRDRCVEILSMPLDPSANLGLTNIVVASKDQTTELTWGKNLPISVEEASKICQSANTIGWRFE